MMQATFSDVTVTSRRHGSALQGKHLVYRLVGRSIALHRPVVMSFGAACDDHKLRSTAAARPNDSSSTQPPTGPPP